MYRLGSGSEAAPPGELHAVSAELLARWMVAQYPRREYPAAIVGSSSGALAHLAAALGVPFLPQTFLLPVAQPQVAPDDPRHGLAAGAGPGRLLLDANPEVALHHMHDPNQDRLSLARMTYFRIKRRRLGAAFTTFLADTLPRGATLLVAGCRLRWPVSRLGDRHVFQFGALGGMPAEEFRTGSPRVADYLRRYGAAARGWDPPPGGRRRPRGGVGVRPGPVGRPERDRAGTGVAAAPASRSTNRPLPARWSPTCTGGGTGAAAGRRTGCSSSRSCCSIRTSSSRPAWCRTGRSSPSSRRQPHRSATSTGPRTAQEQRPCEEILLTLFQHGTDGVGVAPIERWRELIGRAGRHGAFLGVDPRLHPRDFASFGRFHRELAGMRRGTPPAPLTLQELDLFLTERPDDAVSWDG